MSDEEIIVVVQAHKEGKQIQYKLRGTEFPKWNTSLVPVWNFNDYDYRVKPEPRKPREWRIKFENGLITGHSEAIHANFTKDWVHVREVLND